jgi:hypothetical protein
MATAQPMSTVRADFDLHGFVVLPGYLDAEHLAPAQATLRQLLPGADEFHDDPEGDSFTLSHRFPYPAVEWSLLTVAPPLVDLAEALLGTSDIRVSEAHNWAKFTGAKEYDQLLHRDYGNHTVIAHTRDPRFGEVEMFIWIHDVAADAGPTHVVSRTLTDHLPPGTSGLRRSEHPEIYAAEIPTPGPAGTVVAYTNDTFHRGTAMTAPRGSRYALKVSFQVAGPHWMDRMNLLDSLGPSWIEFVNRATPRMLQLFGFPAPGDPYWTPLTYEGTCFRYPDADLSAFAPAPLHII